MTTMDLQQHHVTVEFEHRRGATVYWAVCSCGRYKGPTRATEQGALAPALEHVKAKQAEAAAVPDLTPQQRAAAGVCPSGKKRFRTELEAMKAVTAAKVQNVLHGNGKRREQRQYACPLCWGFHLSSKPDPRAAEERAS